MGRNFWVCEVTGSDANNGQTPITAFATKAHAAALCEAGRGDKVFLLPGWVRVDRFAPQYPEGTTVWTRKDTP